MRWRPGSSLSPMPRISPRRESGSASPGRSRSPSAIGQTRLVATALPAWPVLPSTRRARDHVRASRSHGARRAAPRATGEERWAEIWSSGARRLLDEWLYDETIGAWLWTQRFGARETPIVGAAHGLVGNVHVLLRGGSLLPAAERRDVESRAVETMNGWRSSRTTGRTGLRRRAVQMTANDRIRVQWCHGAAGVLISLWDLAPDDDAWSELLIAGGRLVWEAGPFRDEPGLCHGTAGNAYALLALWKRTGTSAGSSAREPLRCTQRRRSRSGRSGSAMAATRCSRATKAWRSA